MSQANPKGLQTCNRRTSRTKDKIMNKIQTAILTTVLAISLSGCTAIAVVDGVASLGVKAATKTVGLAAKGVGATAKGIKKIATDDEKDKKE